MEVKSEGRLSTSKSVMDGVVHSHGYKRIKKHTFKMGLQSYFGSQITNLGGMPQWTRLQNMWWPTLDIVAGRPY